MDLLAENRWNRLTIAANEGGLIHGRTARRRLRFDDINMTPLIDIVLVVLIIMMVNIPIQVEKMGVKLPSKVETRTDPPPPSEQLVIAMYEDGSYALSKTLLEEEMLFAEVSRRLMASSKKIVFVDAHPTIEYGTVVDMVDMAKEAGAETVSFARLKEEGPAPATKIGPGAMPRGVYPGTPQVIGAITEKSAFEQFNPMIGVAKGCYNARLSVDPSLSGRFLVQVDIGPMGEVMNSDIISNTMADPEVAKCVLEKVPALQYKTLGDQKTARVHYPLIFSPG